MVIGAGSLIRGWNKADSATEPADLAQARTPAETTETQTNLEIESLITDMDNLRVITFANMLIIPIIRK